MYTSVFYINTKSRSVNKVVNDWKVFFFFITQKKKQKKPTNLTKLPKPPHSDAIFMMKGDKLI